MQRAEELPPRISRRQFLQGGAEVVAGVAGMAVFGCGRSESRNQNVPSPTSEIDQSYHNLDDLYSSNSEPFHKFEPILTPTNLVFDYKGNVPAEDRKLIEEAAYAAREYYFKELETYIKGAQRFNVENNPENPNQARGGGSIYLNIARGQDTWRDTSDVERRSIVAHEMFHTVQRQLGGYKTARKFWLFEGAAQYAGLMTFVDQGLISYKDMIELQKKYARVPGKLPPLGSLNSLTRGAPYALGLLAIDMLVGQRGTKALGELYKRTAPFEQAFEQEFGETVESFEARVEAWRAQNNI